MIATFGTKVKDLTACQYFEVFSKYFSRLKRILFVDHYIRKQPLKQLKKEYLIEFGITARQFNSLHSDLKGDVESFLGKRKYDIANRKEKIKSTEKWIQTNEKKKEKLHKKLMKTKQHTEKFDKLVEEYRNLKFNLHHKKRKLRNLQDQLNTWEKELKQKIIRICFGSKKLFKKQHHLEENGWKEHQEWKEQWEKARNSQFFIVGSKDETFGNQSCTYNLNNQMEMRVAYQFEKEFGEYIILTNLTFPYGQEVLEQAKIFQTVYKPSKGKVVKKKEFHSSISYRIIKGKKEQWYIHATVERDEAKIETLHSNGLIGIDYNAGFISLTEVDRFGNPLEEWSVPIRVDGTGEQIEASIGEATKFAVNLAKAKQKAIAKEDLDFSKKKQQMGEVSHPKYNRMLSQFSYSKFGDMLIAKAKREGVEVLEVNPFATSLVGQLNFMSRYGLSSHGSAACVIARRGMKFPLETPHVQTALPLPKVKRHLKPYYAWLSVSKNIKKVCSFSTRISILSADS